MLPTMAFPPAISEALQLFKHAAEEIEGAHQARAPHTGQQADPRQMREALVQFFAIIANLDKEEGATGPILSDDVNQLGDYGLNLLADLAAWATQLGLDRARQDVLAASVTAADWLMRHEGRIRSLEPVVNALADSANRTSDPQELTRMAAFMGAVAQSCSDYIKQDLENTNPGRPWRLLHLNRGIVATRSHDLALMQQVFDDLVRCLPDDAPAFFEQGMEQMVALNYPAPVREIMSRYHARWKPHPTLH
jgi:hypothetical protein